MQGHRVDKEKTEGVQVLLPSRSPTLVPIRSGQSKQSWIWVRDRWKSRSFYTRDSTALSSLAQNHALHVHFPGNVAPTPLSGIKGFWAAKWNHHERVSSRAPALGFTTDATRDSSPVRHMPFPQLLTSPHQLASNTFSLKRWKRSEMPNWMSPQHIWKRSKSYKRVRHAIKGNWSKTLNTEHRMEIQIHM